MRRWYPCPPPRTAGRSGLKRNTEDGPHRHLNDGPLTSKTHHAFKALNSAVENVKGKRYVSADDRKAIDSAASEAKSFTETLIQRLKHSREEVAKQSKITHRQRNTGIEQRNEISTLKEKGQRWERDLKTKEKELKDAFVSNTYYQNVSAGVSEQLKQLQAEYERAKGEVEKLQSQVEDQTQPVKKKEEIIKTLQNKLTQAERDLGSRTTDLRMCEGIIAAKDTELTLLKKSDADKSKQTIQQNATIEQNATRMKQLENAVNQENRELSELKNTLETQSVKLAEVKTTLATRDGQITALTADGVVKDAETTQLKVTMEKKAAETEMLWDRLMHLQGESKKRMRSD